MINICEKCKNKDVCKWIEYVNKTYDYIEEKEANNPVQIKIECNKAR